MFFLLRYAADPASERFTSLFELAPCGCICSLKLQIRTAKKVKDWKCATKEKNKTHLNSFLGKLQEALGFRRRALSPCKLSQIEGRTIPSIRNDHTFNSEVAQRLKTIYPTIKVLQLNVLGSGATRSETYQWDRKSDMSYETRYIDLFNPGSFDV
jgi:hypothetical protein